jgi:hypothetical protein
MKGMVFTEFIEMVEEVFSADMADDIIEDADLPSGGAYTAIGTYDHGEMVSLVGQLSQRTGVPVPDLLRAFGRHLFGRFSILYPEMFQDIHSVFDFLKKIESYIHVEVRKLYPDAQLPSFDHQEQDDRFELHYRSQRPFADLAEGLILGCIAHFDGQLVVNRHDISSPPGTEARFVVTHLVSSGS